MKSTAYEKFFEPIGDFFREVGIQTREFFVTRVETTNHRVG